MWVGTYDDEDEFFGYLEKVLGYLKTDANDEPVSAFITATDVKEYDENFTEGCYFDPADPAELDASYFSTFGDKVRADLDGHVNSAFFMYDVAAEPGPERAPLRLLGVYPYQQVQRLSAP